MGGSPEAGIMALGVHDGSLIWKTLSEEADYASPVLQQTNGQWWIWAWMRDHVHHIHAATGKVHQSIRWRSSMNAAVNAATPLILPEGVFLSASYGTGALLLGQSDGNWSPLWSGDQQMSNHYAHCVYHQGYLYGFHGRQEQSPELRCIEAKSGKVAWTQANLGAGSLILADDRLLLMMESGEWIMAEATPDRWSELGRRQILPSGVRAFQRWRTAYGWQRALTALLPINWGIHYHDGHDSIRVRHHFPAWPSWKWKNIPLPGGHPM